MDWDSQAIPVDEDEGSCPQGRVNRLDARIDAASLTGCQPEAGKIERSAEAFRVC